MKKIINFVMVLSLLVTLLTGCGTETQQSAPSTSSANNSDQQPSIKYLRMASGSQGANWFMLGAAMMNVAGQNMGSITTSNGPGGAVANIKSVNNAEFEMGWGFTSTTYDAYNGVNSFEGETKKENLRHVMSLFPSYTHNIVSKDSSIQGFEELGDKVVNYLPSTESSHVVIENILDEYGITQDTLAENGGSSLEVRIADASELMKNKQLDFWTFTTSAPASAVSELAFQPGIKFLTLDGQKREDILKRLPGFTAMQIPAGTYDGQSETVETIGTITEIFVNKDIPDQVVYDFLTAMYEHWDEVVAVNPIAMSGALPENWLKGNSIPVHPGAQKFYDEKGIKAE